MTRVCKERALRVLLRLQPLTTTAYSLRVMPAIDQWFAGMARSYNFGILYTRRARPCATTLFPARV
jgi:hypothetical protein